MAFIKENLSTIAVGAAIFCGAVFIIVRSILNTRKGKLSCGCDKCKSRAPVRP